MAYLGNVKRRIQVIPLKQPLPEKYLAAPISTPEMSTFDTASVAGWTQPSQAPVNSARGSATTTASKRKSLVSRLLDFVR